MRFTHLICAILACLALVACAAGDRLNGLPIRDTTIEAIRKDPWSFDGKLVRVRGIFDECVSYQCRMCMVRPTPERADRDLCMGVSFEGSGETPSSAAHLDTYARFTDASVLARYHAGCSSVQKPGSGDLIVCTDRASELEEALVVEVHQRLPATKGEIEHYGTEALLRPDAETALELKRSFLVAQSSYRPYVLEDLQYTFLLPSFREDGSPDEPLVGGVCVCNEESCAPDDWPTLSGHVWLEALANPYSCWLAELDERGWRYSPN